MSRPILSARMGASVYLDQSLRVDVEINSGRREMSMAEHFLQGPKIRPALNHVAGEAVSQKMWVDRPPDAGPTRVGFQAIPEGPSGQRAAVMSKENGPRMVRETPVPFR